MSDNRLYPPLAALRAFEAVGRLGGIRRAARELTIDHAVVSRHVRSLEGWVGVPLIVRMASGRRLTDQGEAYHREITEALTAISAATGRLMAGVGALSLHVCCIPGFATLWLSDRLAEFIAENDELQVDFRPSDETPDFRGKDVDCDIRYIREWEKDNLPRGVKQLEIARPAIFPVASPELLSSLPPIETAADLIGCPLLHEDGDDEWTHWLAAQGAAPVEPLQGPRLWHAHLTLSAARRGRGIALANNMLLGDDLKNGELVRIEPRRGQFVPTNLGAYVLLAREDRWNAPAVFRFRRWIQQAVTKD